MNRNWGMRWLMDNVRDFHVRMGASVDPEKPLLNPQPALVRLRAKLITEEYMETMAGMFKLPISPAGLKADIKAACDALNDVDVHFDIEAIADGLCDLIYVCVGAALAFGIPLDRVWSEVQRANMDKVGGGRRNDGKVLKPPGWVGPRIKEAIFGDQEA